MTDIVKKLRSPVDEKEDYFISQWPGEEPKTHDAVRFQAADEIERLRAVLELYRDSVRIDATMEGPVFMGANRSSLKRAWDADIAAMEGK